MTGSLQIKSGKYYAVFHSDGKTKWHNLKIEAKRGNKRKAEQAMAEIARTYADSPAEYDKIEFSEFINKWLEEVKYQVDIITYRGYTQYTKKHIIPYFKKKKLALQDVKIKDIENYYYHKATSGRLDGKPGGLSKSTLKHHSVILSLVFKKAMHDELISNNPCQYAKIPKLAKTQSVAKFYTAEECSKLLELAEGTPLYDMVYITAIYGLRRSELLGIKWDAVDFKNKTLTIKHTVVLNTDIVACKDSTKNKTSMRTYPLLDDIEEILLRIKKQQDEYRKLFGNCYQESGYVFTKEDGSMRHPSYPSQMLTKTLKKNNMPHLRWHDLRHSCASILVLKGWQMKEISEWLGHADIGTTMNIYGHLNLDHKRKLGSTLNGLFDKKAQ